MNILSNGDTKMQFIMKKSILKKELNPVLKKAYSILWHVVAFSSISLIIWNTIQIIGIYA